MTMKFDVTKTSTGIIAHLKTAAELAAFERITHEHSEYSTEFTCYREERDIRTAKFGGQQHPQEDGSMKITIDVESAEMIEPLFQWCQSTELYWNCQSDYIKNNEDNFYDIYPIYKILKP